MAQVFGEFDAASPAPKSFCARLTMEQYERQSTASTELALKELLDYLEYNPTAFFDIIMKRKDEEKEDGGFMSFVKTKMLSWIYGHKDSSEFDLVEAKDQLKILKEDLIKSFNYGQEAKGSMRRFSYRLAERKWRKVESARKRKVVQSPVSQSKKENVEEEDEEKETIFPVPPTRLFTPVPNKQQISEMSQLVPPPPPPPPPPLPPTSKNKETVKESVTLKKLEDKENLEVHRLSSKLISEQQKNLKPVKSTLKKKRTSRSGSNFTKIMESIKNSNTRKVLKPIQNSDSFVTPAQLYKRQKAAERSDDALNMFNQELIKKFRNVHNSPLVESPDHGSFTP